MILRVTVWVYEAIGFAFFFSSPSELTEAYTAGSLILLSRLWPVSRIL